MTTIPSISALHPQPFIPDNAPFTPSQRAWLNGFLAGLFAPGVEATAQPSSLPALAAIPLTILYGTQTGTAASLSRLFAKEAGKRGYAAKAIDMADFKAAQLQNTSHLLLVTSTYGDGEPPDGAKALHAELHSDSAPRLDHLEFAVLGLGDTNYEKFCACAIEFDERLAKLGGQRIYSRVDCDLDYEAAAQAWLEGVFAVWKEKAPGPFPSPLAEISAPPTEAVPAYGKTRPYPARLLENRLLNGMGSAKETRHLSFSLADSGLSYEPGDALGVFPSNCPELVDDLLRATGFDGEEAVPGADGQEKPLRLALSRDYDISTLNRSLVEKFAKFRGVSELEALLDPSRTQELSAFLYGRQWLDLLVQYPILGSRPADFIALLKKLQPRLYSIASSIRAYPAEVHLCVGVVRYTAHGRLRKGVCSSYLADRIEETAPVFFHSNPNFRLPPDPARDVIMIGPGTGIAPFRAFLQERRSIGATGRNWLFFGDQKAATDFLYRPEIESLQASGYLHRLDLAFSRDQTEKIYVQQRMEQEASELWRWLDGGAHLYVCGDASRMAKDVDATLHRIVETQGSLKPDAAKQYIAQLKADKRYQRDVY